MPTSRQLVRCRVPTQAGRALIDSKRNLQPKGRCWSGKFSKRSLSRTRTEPGPNRTEDDLLAVVAAVNGGWNTGCGWRRRAS